MRISNMANTFHKLLVESNLSEEAGVTASNRSITTRLYLQQDPCLRNHAIWRQEGFWDSALFIGIAAELDHRDAVLWDDLPAETLREEVVGKAWSRLVRSYSFITLRWLCLFGGCYTLPWFRVVVSRYP